MPVVSDRLRGGGQGNENLELNNYCVCVCAGPFAQYVSALEHVFSGRSAPSPWLSVCVGGVGGWFGECGCADRKT